MSAEPGAATAGVTMGAVSSPATGASSTSTVGSPSITAIDWVAPVNVLGGEASEFTPWLADNLDVIGVPLGLEDLELVAREVDVAGKRLDILAAIGADDAGLSIAVAIEAQYGTSDHDHLGKLITYAAGAAATHDRVLGVWLVDNVHPAHEAAIELLNRESTDRLGFVLARVRFVSTGPGSWAVDVDVVAQPNEFLREQRHKVQTPTNIEREQFLSEVMELARLPLLDAGFKTVSGSKANGYTADITWPQENRWRINVRAGDESDNFRALVYANGGDSTEENELVLAEIVEHSDLVEAEVAPFGAELNWAYHAANNHAKKAALGLCRFPGLGYGSDPKAAADRLIAFGRGVAKAATKAGS